MVKGSIHSRVPLGKGFNWSLVNGIKASWVQLSNCTDGSFGLRVNMVQRFNWFNKLEGSIALRVQYVQGLNLFKCFMDLINSSFQLVQGFN